MMDKNEVFNKIADLVADQFDIDREKINGSLNFRKDLDADSIDFVEFVLDLEDTFNAEISDDDAEKLNTIDEAVDYVMSHQKD
ncbi:Acyl carrier protein [Lentilactobacillus hilgardii]|uniref:Acyl carrier protein n=2 Tax=Lentilactobacillus hilgardii TaxID=1588 RepID=C0XM53_LENH9|nr:acyl carrier protein [Lentilactobacillus buchneri ATCC 11577]EEI23592.1 acyl carrier protein [Lentilactobacillus hilgardii DSM 20176 = ATCC 8290]MCT3397395.1 acyl carrier protein [Lentilactobacillus hilgardii]KRK56981.1 acyl carrier protein [Lentilactobacillus hilgardii DSM 20176 = ATCC 8290]QEU38663.1 acyl carrier protein [Lentilactobacillus hilgardii]